MYVLDITDENARQLRDGRSGVTVVERETMATSSLRDVFT